MGFNFAFGQDDISLFQQYNGRYDYIAIGNTLILLQLICIGLDLGLEI